MNSEAADWSGTYIRRKSDAESTHLTVCLNVDLGLFFELAELIVKMS